MRITSIELAGSVEPGKTMPMAFARIHRALDSEQIEVTILCPRLPGGERTHHVQADCDEDLWSMAECLQAHLDGCTGTNSMIHDYYRELQRFAD